MKTNKQNFKNLQVQKDNRYQVTAELFFFLLQMILISRMAGGKMEQCHMGQKF